MKLSPEQRKINRKKTIAKYWRSLTTERKSEHRALVRAYRYSLRGKLTWTYLNMRKRVEGRCPRKVHLYAGLPICSREEFITWGLQNPEYIRLYDQWQQSGYVPALRPSIDRVDPRYGYLLWNMQWLTLSENSSKAGYQRHHGVSAA